MKTPQQIRNEVEKGCGGSLRGGKIAKKGYKYYCGNNLKRSNKVAYCMRCQAQLSILTEYDNVMKEMIEDLGKRLKKNQYLCFNSIMKEEIDKELNLILSKIGDNSEVKE